MKTIAFGGYLYPIAKWLPPTVTHYACPLRGFTDAWCRRMALSLKSPTRLIGFSAGANAALRVAHYSPLVDDAVIHSCSSGFERFGRHCRYRFFVTQGDTTPTYQGTHDTVAAARRASAVASFKLLPFVSFDRPTLFERWQLAPRNHVFHNAMPHLDLGDPVSGSPWSRKMAVGVSHAAIESTAVADMLP